MKILVTGGAGFIGFHTAKALLEKGHEVIIADTFNDYYDTSLKEARIERLPKENLTVIKADISDEKQMDRLFKEQRIDKVCHLAAQAGVRYSLENPLKYERSNSLGTLTLLEMCRRHNVADFIFASSSSVYGQDTAAPFNEKSKADRPISLYAATKRATELSAHVYHHLYGMNCIGLRFFTVYGPWGRPDMAYYSFTKKIIEGRPIDVYGKGDTERDLTYISDIIIGILSALDKKLGFEIINLGNNHPIKLIDFITAIEKILGKTAKKNMKDIPAGDVTLTYADISKAKSLLGYEPKTGLEEGLKRFIEWYKEYTDNNE